MTPHPWPERTSVFIWGSCVSRDTVALLPQVHVDTYVARHSLISASTDASDLELQPLPSPFQQRMSVWDLAGRAPRLLGEAAPRVDLVLMDLCDERLGVYEVRPGVYVTRTIERIAAGVDARWAQQYRHIPFGSNEHLDLWTAAAVQVLRRLRLLHRSHLLRMVALPWAHQDDRGRPTARSSGLTAERANQLTHRYLAGLSGQGVHVLGQDIDAVADSAHRWGPAPFHYTEATYRALLDELADDLPHPPPR